MSCARTIAAALLALVLGGCQMGDDLNPSSRDQRPEVNSGSTGYMPGQKAADFTLPTIDGTDFTLSDHLAGGTDPADAVVLYFTMWCPICLAHTDHLHAEIVPRFEGRGTVVWALVDYVSGSVEVSRATALANGYGGAPFTTLVDGDQRLLDQLNGAMGTVVVIGPDGTIELNEDYRTGADLAATLERLLP